MATFGGLLFGYDTGVINGAFSSLKQYMALTPTTEGLVMSVLLVGAALGSVFGGKFADYFGRRKYLLFLSFVFLIGALLSAAAPDITTLLIARALLVCRRRRFGHRPHFYFRSGAYRDARQADRPE
ncbi:hypothetical protein KPZU40_36490 [Klebsiella pneumoniae]|nr:hypothetical protein KPZU40_36490 [Klebsiella pneumoniae]